MGIVVWQSAFLGDLVLTTNLLLNLERAFPEGVIKLVARPFAVELFKNWERVEVIPLEKTLRGTWRVIRSIRGSELGFGVQRGLRTSLSLYLAGVKERVGFQNAELSFLYTKRVDHRWGIHEVERNQNLLKAVGIKPYTDRLFLPVSEEDLQRVRDKFRLPERYIAVSPSANFLPKRWAEGHFAKLIDLLLEEGFKVVLTGGKGDTEVSHRVLSLVRDPKGVFDLSGKTSVGELVAVIKLAKILVSNDSAPVHIAEAVGTPAVSVYCATSSHYGFYPRSGLYFEPKNLNCHPCKPNPKVCKTGTLECRYAVKPEEVFEGVLNLLEG